MNKGAFVGLVASSITMIREAYWFAVVIRKIRCSFAIGLEKVTHQNMLWEFPLWADPWVNQGIFVVPWTVLILVLVLVLVVILVFVLVLVSVVVLVLILILVLVLVLLAASVVWLLWCLSLLIPLLLSGIGPIRWS
jgi:hypothetical protein